MPLWNHAMAVAAALVLTTGAAFAEPTEITVRVLSKGAKFVGTSMGGARIVIRDADTGEVLATGVTEGSTGDTEKLVGARERGKPVSTDDSAKFTAVLELDRPRLIEVTAIGPLAQRQSAVSASSTQWVVPGKNITGGDGCPIEPDGLWDANKYEVAAILSRNGKVERTIPLAYAGKTSQFDTEIELDEKGVYEATVYAYDPANGNTGLDRVTFVIR